MIALGALGLLISPHSIISWLFLAAGLLMTGILVWDWWTVGRKLPNGASTDRRILIAFGGLPPMGIPTFIRRLAMTIVVVGLMLVCLLTLLVLAEGIR